ncbi:MAG: hypothetical protein AAF958_14560 [Planctomycetota bacterium]
MNQILTQAWTAFRAGSLREVVRLLETNRSDSEEPQSIDTLVLLGRAYHDLGRPFEAADALERASLIGPISDEARIVLASSYAELRRTDLARELYLQLALSRRLPAELMLQVAAGLSAIDAPELAMKVCEWITEKDDSIAKAYYDMGVYSALSGNALYLTEALTRRAIQLDDANVHYRVGLVSLLIQLDRKDEALEAFSTVDESRVHTIECVTCLQRIESLLRECGQSDSADICQDRIDRLQADKARHEHPASPGAIE